MAGCTCLCACAGQKGRRIAGMNARRLLVPLSFSLLSTSSRSTNEFRRFRIQESENACAALDSVADLGLDLRRRLEQHVGAGSEFDHSHPLATLHAIADFFAEDNAAREQPGDLLEDDGVTLPLECDRVLLVAFGAGWVHGIQEFALLIMRRSNHPSCRRAIHVHVKNVQENADALNTMSIYRDHRDVGHFSIRGRNDSARIGRYAALGIAEKPKE